MDKVKKFAGSVTKTILFLYTVISLIYILFGSSWFSKPARSIDPVKADTLIVEKIREVPVPVKIDRLKAKKDTVKLYVDLRGNIIEDIQAYRNSNSVDELTEMFAEVASADTVFKRDSSSISVKYFYEPLSYFQIKANIKCREVEKTVKVTEYKTISFEVPQPFYKNKWFYTTLGTAAVLIWSIK